MESLWRFDQEAFRAIHIGLHRDWLDPVFWVITSTGLGWVQAVLILLVPLIADLRHEMRRRPFLEAVWSVWKNPVFAVWPLLLTTGVSGIFFAQGVKRLIAERDRPSLLDYAVPQEDITRNSFPSGHSTTAFAIAFMLFFLTWRSDKAWIGRYALVWAFLVGISRIYRGVHWPTDVVGGIFAGLLSSTVVYVLVVARTKVEEGPPVTSNPPHPSHLHHPSSSHLPIAPRYPCHRMSLIPVSQSRVEMAQIMEPNDANFLGKVFGGRILEMIDLCAYAASSKYAGRICVTASFDRVDFHEPINVGELVTMVGFVSFVGRTSLEITIEIYAQNLLTRDQRHTNTARVTMVAIDQNGKPAPVPSLLAETRDEKLRFLEGKLRRELRAQQRADLDAKVAQFAQSSDEEIERLLKADRLT